MRRDNPLIHLSGKVRRQGLWGFWYSDIDTAAVVHLEEGGEAFRRERYQSLRGREDQKTNTLVYTDYTEITPKRYTSLWEKQ